MVAYKTIAQNLADTAMRTEEAAEKAQASAKEARRAQADAFAIVERLTRENEVLKAENVRLKALLAQPAAGVMVADVLAVPAPK